MRASEYLIVPFLQAFFWFDDGLQAWLQKCGWGHVSRPQSMVMVNILSGTCRPSDIARNLGISRQAVHATINQMAEMGMVEMSDDPEDGRSKIVVLSQIGQSMRRDADAAVIALTEELARRIGKGHIAALHKAFEAEWGEAPIGLSPPPKARPKPSPRGKRS